MSKPDPLYAYRRNPIREGTRALGGRLDALPGYFLDALAHHRGLQLKADAQHRAATMSKPGARERDNKRRREIYASRKQGQ